MTAKASEIFCDRTALEFPHFALCVSEEEFFVALKAMQIRKDQAGSWLDASMGACTHTFESAEGIACVVCVDGTIEYSFPRIASFMAHEATHIAHALFQTIGEECPGEEIWCYAVQYCTEELIRSYLNRAESVNKKIA
jgi:hypothetical protein